MEIIKSLLNSFRYASRGINEILRTERNARIHLVVACVVILAGILVKVSSFELALIFFAIMLVFLAEMSNTAIEKTLDLVDPENNPKVARIKDMAAGAVLVASIGAVIMGVAIFWPYLIGILWGR